MLHSLEIRNYRNLKHLTIEKLGRVNLLVGKNNTGKTSVLEAVYFIAKKGALESFYQILSTRNEHLNSAYRTDQVDRNVNSLAYLFHNQIITNHAHVKLKYQLDSEEEYFLFRISKVKQFDDLTRKSIDSDESMLEIHLSSEQPRSVLLRDPLNSLKYFPPREIQAIDLVEFIISNQGVNLESQNSLLFENIELTEKEKYVIEALKTLDVRIDALAFRSDLQSGKRYPVIRINETQNVFPLRSMGDGINRILTIILAMVNCEKGYLLIDEFENGLHYSVQEKLWEIIFYLAERLDIQVFATTHSSDTIRSFATVLAQQTNAPEAGKVIRLQNHDSNIVAVEYTPEELEAAVEFGVEVR